MDLLKALLVVSEKAANIARKIRENEHLFELLIQKKEGKDSNPRFLKDFKTLADVLIQEIVRHDISKQFPSLKDRIRGEESNVFCNTLGESIHVEILAEVSETTSLLQRVLNGDEEAAELLATESHRTVTLDEVNTTELPDETFAIDLEDCGIWIDPIDSTTEYINGIERLSDNGVCIAGLKCATVLIGVYSMKTQQPIMGVINQPFASGEDTRWRGKCIWGISTNDFQRSYSNENPTRTGIVSLSTSESDEIKAKLKNRGYEVLYAAGAGYKILTVLTGAVDAYIISKDSTYKWDTCGPQAILRSMGGDALQFSKLSEANKTPLKYPSDSEDHCNRGGFIAYRSEKVLNDLMELFAK